jgi:carboxymuconolactone decarboxylase family protein
MPSIPRLESEQLTPNVAEMLAPRIKRLGYLGEFFKCAAHQPDALVSFMAFTEDLKHALPDRLTEVVALTVSTTLENAYERHQHERLCLKLGFGEAWIRAVEDRPPPLARDAGEPRRGLRRESGAMQPTEMLVQDLTLAVLDRHGKNTTAELDAVVAAIGPQQAIGVLMLIGRYVTHALMVNALDLAPPVPSPLG